VFIKNNRDKNKLQLKTYPTPDTVVWVNVRIPYNTNPLPF
jgi:hypothetical protein